MISMARGVLDGLARPDSAPAAASAPLSPEPHYAGRRRPVPPDHHGHPGQVRLRRHAGPGTGAKLRAEPGAVARLYLELGRHLRLLDAQHLPQRRPGVAGVPGGRRIVRTERERGDRNRVGFRVPASWARPSSRPNPATPAWNCSSGRATWNSSTGTPAPAARPGHAGRAAGRRYRHEPGQPGRPVQRGRLVVPARAAVRQPARCLHAGQAATLTRYVPGATGTASDHRRRFGRTARPVAATGPPTAPACW